MRLLLINVFCCLLLCQSLLGVTSSQAEEFMAGADISALPSLEAAGSKCYEDGQQKDAVELFRNNGVNWAHLRLFVDPTGENIQD